MKGFKKTTVNNYSRGYALDEFHGVVSLVEAWQKQDGEIGANWGKKEIAKDREVRLPWGLQLCDIGDEKVGAALLRHFADILAGDESSQPEPVHSSPTDRREPGDDEDVPF